MTAAPGLHPACLWCGSHATRLLQADVARLGTLSFDVHECNACRCRFSPQDAPLDYDAVRTHHAWYRLLACDAEAVRRLLAQGPEPFFTAIAAAYLNHLPWSTDRRYREVLAILFEARAAGRRLRLLEVGFGCGVIGAIAARLGHTYLGVDLPGRAVTEARERFAGFGARYEAVEPDWFLTATPPDERWDVAFSSEVIEHVRAPRRMLARLLALAAPGGILVVTTPDLDRFRQWVWAGDLPPLHAVFLHREAIREAVRTFAPAAWVECFDEDLGPDPAFELAQALDPPPPLLSPAPAARADVDPASPGYHCRSANVVWPLETLPRYERRAALGTDTALALALLHGARRLGAVLVTVVHMPPAP